MTRLKVAFHNCFENEPTKGCELDLTYSSLWHFHTLESTFGFPRRQIIDWLRNWHKTRQIWAVRKVWVMVRKWRMKWDVIKNSQCGNLNWTNQISLKSARWFVRWIISTEKVLTVHTQCPSNAYRYSVHSVACLGSVTQASHTQTKWFLGFSWFVSQHQLSPHPANLWGLTLTSLTLQLIWLCLCLTQIFLSMAIGPLSIIKVQSQAAMPKHET